MDYGESIQVMIEFISKHPITVPHTKIPNPSLPLRILHKYFERIKIENDVLEVKIVDDKFVPVHKSIFLKEIDIPKNPKGFVFRNPQLKSFTRFSIKSGIKEKSRPRNLRNL